MKNLFLIGMAAVSMMCASCSSDENVEMANNKNAIEFKTFVNNSTRATDLTTTSLMKFKLWGRMEKEDLYYIFQSPQVHLLSAQFLLDGYVWYRT